MMNKLQLGFLTLIGLCSTLFVEPASAARCLFVSSYHQGYAWSDGVERGLRSVLDGRCELKQFDMDTKRHKTIEDKQQAAESARQIDLEWKPDEQSEDVTAKDDQRLAAELHGVVVCICCAHFASGK